jgi:hypothetical protein
MAGSRVVRPTKEKFYVRVEAGDGGVAFFDATDHVGKTMPFAKPRATCAMRVSPEAVSFSLLHLTNKNAQNIAAKPVVIPRGPLARLERRAVSYAPLEPTRLIVELSTRPAGAPGEEETAGGLEDLFGDAPAGVETPAAGLGDLFEDSVKEDSAKEEEATGEAVDGDKMKKKAMRPSVIEQFELVLRRDENGVAHVEAKDDDHSFELPRGAVHVSLYLASPIKSVNRVLSIGFIGHVGKPETMETVTRVASMVLNSLSHLPDFRILSGIETCVVPANPNRGERKAAQRQASERVQFPVRVYLFDDQTQPVANGLVGVEIDLENANPTTGKLLLNLTPEKSLEEAFDRYRPVIERAVMDQLFAALGEEGLSNIVYDVVLGSITSSIVDDLKKIGKSFAAFDLTPSQFRTHA